MKTFLNVRKIIDWSSNERPTVGKPYYFGETIWGLEYAVKHGFTGILLEDRDFDFKLSYSNDYAWVNFLYPVED